MVSYVVTGAARGIGYGFIKVLAANPDNVVIGLARNPQAAKDRLAEDSISNVHIVQGDITDVLSLKKAASEAANILGDKGLDVLINNGAYVSDVTSLRSLDEDEHNLQFLVDDFNKSFNTNVIGVLNTINQFLPLIKMGKEKKIVAISSGMGDIDFINEAHISNAAPYAVSKAALSTLIAKINAAYESQGILAISICPGFVDTAVPGYTPSEDDLVRLQKIGAKFAAYAPDLKGQLTPEESATSVLAAIHRASHEKGSGGTFLSHNGTKRWL